MAKQSVASGQAGSKTKPGGQSGGGQKQQKSSGGGMLVKSSTKEFQKQNIRAARRTTVDPWTTEVVMKQVMGLRQGIVHGKPKLTKPEPEFAPRVFPGSKSIVKQPLKRAKF